MTNYRLESFRNAFQNLQLLPLVTPEDLDRFRVEYGTEILEELEQLVEDCSPDNNKIIFTGHRGSGKSTLLGQLCREMGDNYFVVFFSISDLIEMSDVNHVNILFAMAVKLMEEAENRGVKISPKTKKAFYVWFSKHTRTESTSIDSSLEIETSGEVGANALFAKFFAKLKATLKANSVIREEIATEFARRISDLVDRVNDIAIAIQAVYGKEVLVVIDDLDKLDLEIVDRVYRNNISALFQPQFRIIYTIPMAATRDMSLRGIIRNATNNRIQSMWATKFFPRGEAKNPNPVPVEASVKVFEEILYKRIPRQLIEPQVAQMLILKSGGALREFIRLASQCCKLCLVQLRRKPENQDLKITTDIFQRAVTDLRIEYTEPLGQNAFDILLQVYRDYIPADGMDQTFLDLLHTLYILEYRNDDLWFGVNPIVQEILERRGLIKSGA
ncbi:P-loop NTPase fold protein [Limnofasciculus baicalensis]|uniref:ATP-binding protein n=1 Tax=Limnofasciculus baicalensis BBK-W-15 TaxID=2699891 RepID=A0AAE3GYG5_9CYAN|nr:P-loop NTPase fold protein [Limnofasciculus baicalensis]MCP2732126.1 ATP-binding protein [Limnofasciculus baicalensis BBK-W-15]